MHDHFLWCQEKYTMSRLRSIPVNYVVIPCISILIMIFGKWYASHASLWYITLKIPPIVPSKNMMALVWHVISILTTAAVLGIWNRAERTMRFWIIMVLFCLNTILNASWSYLFFYQHALAFATLDTCMIATTAITIVVLLWPLSRIVTILLLPYALWSAYATVVMIALWMLNK